MVVTWTRTFGAEPGTEFGLSFLCGGLFENGLLAQRSSIAGYMSCACLNGELKGVTWHGT